MAFPTQSAKYVAASSEYMSAASLAGSPPTGSTARTFEFWFKYSGSAEDTLIDYGSSTGSQTEWQITLDTTPKLWVRLNGGNISWSASGASNGAWHHCAIVYDGTGSVSSSSTTAYLDGTSLGAGTTGGATTVSTSGSATQLGAGSVGAGTPSAYLDGNLSLVRLWNTTRTQLQITSNYCTELGTTTGLVAEWTLDNTLNDNSGNSNTLTNHSATFVSDVSSTCSAAIHMLSALGAGS